MINKEEREICNHIYALWLLTHKEPDRFSEDFKKTVNRLYDIFGADNVYKEA